MLPRHLRLTQALAALALLASGLGSAAVAQDQPGYDTLQTLSVEIDAGVATVVIDNPPINLVDARLMPDLGALAGLLAQDASLRVVVFETALEEFFIARADVALIDRLQTLEGPSTEISPFHGIVEAYRRLPQVTIAKLTGIARGAGSEFALALDMRFAAESAMLGQPEIAFGLHPGGGGLLRLPEMMSRGRVLEIVLSGRDFTAAEAAEYGWINRALPDEELDGFVDDLARQIAGYDGAALTRAKDTLLAHEDKRGLDAYLADFDAFVAAVQSKAATAQVARFLELGPPSVEIERDLVEVLNGLSDD